MRAGPLRHRCQVTRQELVRNASGGASKQWIEVGKLWAEITLPTGRITPVAEQLQATVTAEIRIRHRNDIAAGWQLTERGTTYQVEAVLPDNDRTMMRLLCSSVPNP